MRADTRPEGREAVERVHVSGWGTAAVSAAASVPEEEEDRRAFWA
jgi:hypothetical protein